MTTVRAPKPNQHDRAARQSTIDVLLTRALRGVLTIPEAAVLADYWRAERQLADKTRRSLGDTTRALERHRAAADAAISEQEQRTEQAEDALARVHRLADLIAAGAPWTANHGNLAQRIRDAAEVDGDGQTATQATEAVAAVHGARDLNPAAREAIDALIDVAKKQITEEQT